MLTGSAIRRENGIGLTIDPFRLEQLGPNSYNLRLHNELLVYEPGVILDVKRPAKTIRIPIPEEGYVLQPDELYLGRTVEYTMSRDFVPCIDGRSSGGRFGIFVHLTAGFGDVGYEGAWTLELSCIRPVRIYPNMEICQIFFQRPEGDIEMRYHGKYQGARDILASRYHMDFEGGLN